MAGFKGKYKGGAGQAGQVGQVARSQRFAGPACGDWRVRLGRCRPLRRISAGEG